MERLTEHFGRYIRIKGLESIYSSEYRKSARLNNAIIKLTAYEDTGLTPEEIITLKAPPNAPLTLEELRGMEGQPVWLEADKGGRYAVISFVSKHFVEFTDGAQPSISMYGKSWLAYHRNPEEGTA